MKKSNYVPSRYSWSGDLGIDYADQGAWRSYNLETSGDSLTELAKNAVIFEIDQDGGDLNNYSLEDASSEIYNAAIKVIHDLLNKKYESDREMFERQHKEAGEL